MRVSRTIVRMTVLPVEAQQKIIVKLHSFNVLQKDNVLPCYYLYVAKCNTFVAIIK